MHLGAPDRLLRAVPGAEQVYRAPGRANLIGEHTDYNGGFVLPAALELATWVAGRPQPEGVISLRSLDGDIERHVEAVVSALRDEGIEIAGFDGVVATEVPIGAGLSSSAALEVALACALGGSTLEPARLAAVCHRAENAYLGMQSGIMDQLASAAGEEGHALLIDCRDVTVTPVPLPAALTLLLVDSGVRRGLADSAYNERVAECRAAAEALGVAFLRDAADLGSLSGTLLRRARHVVSENERVLAAADALHNERLDELAELFRASHVSLREDFEVSTPDLDRLVELAEDTDGVVASRLTGAGFGGCTVNLVRAERAEGAGREIVARYGSGGRFWISRPAAGAGSVEV